MHFRSNGVGGREVSTQRDCRGLPALCDLVAQFVGWSAAVRGYPEQRPVVDTSVDAVWVLS